MKYKTWYWTQQQFKRKKYDNFFVHASNTFATVINTFVVVS